tara:strand:- start:4731 stop:4874 length:144 start_codon:yes stop_codon:yes gene_type:complete
MAYIQQYAIISFFVVILGTFAIDLVSSGVQSMADDLAYSINDAVTLD